MGGIDKIEDEGDVIKLVKDCRAQAIAAHSEWRDECRENYDMVSGKQWATEDEAALAEQGRAATVFNRLGTIIDAVSGSEVNNRQEVRYIPREIGDVAHNEVLTSAAQWVRDNCDAEDEESDAFVDVLITGIGFTETRMDYEEDEEGKCIIDRVDPLEVRWDPAARKRNLSDAKWIQRERGFTKEQIYSRWPDADIDLSGAAEYSEDDETSPHVTKEPDGYDGSNKSGADRARKLYPVTQHQWYELECVYKVLDPQTQQITELPKEEFEPLQERATKLGMPVQAARINRRVYKQAFVCGETLLEIGPCPCAHDFTIQAITGRRDRNNGVWYGLVRPMKDPQRWANKFFSQLLHIINTNAKGGLMMEKGAAENPRKFERDWAKADSVVTLNPGAIAQGKIQPKPTPVIPPAISELMNFSISSIRDTSGVSLELLGMADREQAGYLEAQRTKAGLTILAGFFDGLRLYRKRQGRVLAYFIQEYLSDGRLIKVVGKDREQFIPLLKNPEGMKFDVIVDSAPTSRDMKEKTWAALMELLPLVQGMGIPIPPELIEYAPLPSGLIAAWKPKLLQAQQKMEQGDPMQKEMQRVQLEKLKSDVEKGYASADQAQSAAQLNYIKAQVESMAPTLQAIQMALQAFVPKPGPEGQQAPPGQPQAPQQPPPSGGFFTPENGPTPIQ